MKGPMLICFFFERMNTEENAFLFVTTPATNIPWLLPVYFGNVHMHIINMHNKFEKDKWKTLSCKIGQIIDVKCNKSQ